MFLIERRKKKESAQKVWSKHLVHEKTFWLSSRTPILIKFLKRYYTLFYNHLNIKISSIKQSIKQKKNIYLDFN